MLYQVLYSSVATEPLGAQAMCDLLAHARRRNSERGITGVLIYFPVTSEIVQVLEGEKADVLALMDQLRADPRHQRLAIHLEALVCARALGAWPMGYLTAECDEPLQAAHVSARLGGQESAFDRSSGEAIGRRLLRLVRGAVPEGTTVH
jgi:hypothetical protein